MIPFSRILESCLGILQQSSLAEGPSSLCLMVNFLWSLRAAIPVAPGHEMPNFNDKHANWPSPPQLFIQPTFSSAWAILVVLSDTLQLLSQCLHLCTKCSRQSMLHFWHTRLFLAQMCTHGCGHHKCTQMTLRNGSWTAHQAQAYSKFDQKDKYGICLTACFPPHTAFFVECSSCLQCILWPLANMRGKLPKPAICAEDQRRRIYLWTKQERNAELLKTRACKPEPTLHSTASSSPLCQPTLPMVLYAPGVHRAHHLTALKNGYLWSLLSHMRTQPKQQL